MTFLRDIFVERNGRLFIRRQDQKTRQNHQILSRHFKIAKLRLQDVLHMYVLDRTTTTEINLRTWN